MSVPVTALYGALLALFYVFISLNVSRVRGKVRVYLQADKPIPQPLYLAQRAHGNASEYIPLGLLLLLALELSNASGFWLHVFGGTLLVARLSHAVGVLGGLPAAMIPGATLTWLLLFAQAVYLLVLRFR